MVVAAVAVAILAVGFALLLHAVKIYLRRNVTLGVVEVSGGIALMIVGLSLVAVFNT